MMKMMNGLIRFIQERDNKFIAEIINQVMTEFNCVGPGFSIQDLEVQNMSKFYQAKDLACYFVVEVEGVIAGGAGIASLEGTDKKVCELKKMYIKSAYRGQGFGQKLIEACENQARDFAYEGIYLESTPQMIQARNLYLKNSFHTIDHPMGNTGHFSCDSYFYKSLVTS